jgi:nitrite reductase/ring-hydroxylating ferredoxin subunit/uncharacterized membrane protein
VRSRAHFRAHPLHPALIPFPFAFLTGALLFDALGLVRNRPEFYVTGSHLTLIGITTGLIAGVPGLIDYLYSVPPGSSGKRRATLHGLCNITSLALFAAGWLSRAGSGAPTAPTIIFEVAGAVSLVYSGWLGGTLVTRNMISVDHRYANAGKWKEAVFTARPGQPLVVGDVDELKDDQMKLIRVNGKRLVLARTKGSYTAFEDSCTHRGGSLAGGVLIKGTVQCLWHGSQFDTVSGAVSCGPAKKPIRVYEVRETKEGQVLLTSPPE